MAKEKGFWNTLPLRKRLWSIYQELGYIPWRKPRKEKKRRQKGVYMGTREAIIPFMNDDAKRTFSHLLLRPGYMMRDYILRGEHERYLAPFTALLVFYSVFTLIVAVVKPQFSPQARENTVIEAFDNFSVTDTTGVERSDLVAVQMLKTMRTALVLTRLDMHPEEVDTPWKQSLAAVESDLRSKGLPLFLGNFLMLWMAMAVLLRKRGISVSGAAAASAYVLCQYCIFKFLALLFSLGEKTSLGILLMGLLLLIDYRQLLSLDLRPALRLTIKTGLFYALVTGVLIILLSGAVLGFALYKV